MEKSSALILTTGNLNLNTNLIDTDIESLAAASSPPARLSTFARLMRLIFDLLATILICTLFHQIHAILLLMAFTPSSFPASTLLGTYGSPDEFAVFVTYVAMVVQVPLSVVGLWMQVGDSGFERGDSVGNGPCRLFEGWWMNAVVTLAAPSVLVVVGEMMGLGCQRALEWAVQWVAGFA